MKKNRILLVILLNTTIVVVEILFGMMGNSMALVTDALHNFGDILSIIIALIAIIYSEKKATRDMTYGYIRSEMMAGFLNSIFLIFTMLFVLYESIIKLMKPENINGIYMMAVAGVALIANSLSAFLLREFHIHDHHHHDHEEASDGKACKEEDIEETEHHEDLNIKAAYIHLLSDAGISLGVVVGGVIVFFFHWNFIDSLFSILFSIYILWESVKIFRKSFLSLMDAGTKNLGKIEEKILSHPKIKSIHDIHITGPSSKEIFFSAHIVLKESESLEEIEIIIDQLRKDLSEMGVTHVLLQPETEKYHNNDCLCQSHCK